MSDAHRGHGGRSKTWEALVARYEKYRQRPVWGWVRTPSAKGRLSWGDIRYMRDVRARNAVRRVRSAVRRLRAKDEKSPAVPRAFRQSDMDRILKRRLVGSRALCSLRDAIVFDRHGYRCRYCRRNDDEVWEAEGRRRTLALVVDHRRARSKKGGLFVLKNSVTSCWTCNTVKGSLHTQPFLDELRSLAEAVIRAYSKAIRSS